MARRLKLLQEDDEGVKFTNINKLIKKLKTDAKAGCGWQGGYFWFFQEPVTSDIYMQLPGYSDVVKHPYDLGTLQSQARKLQDKKMARMSYRYLTENCERIFANCLHYNGNDFKKDVVVAAHVMRALFRRFWDGDILIDVVDKQFETTGVKFLADEYTALLKNKQDVKHFVNESQKAINQAKYDAHLKHLDEDKARHARKIGEGYIDSSLVNGMTGETYRRPDSEEGLRVKRLQEEQLTRERDADNKIRVLAYNEWPRVENEGAVDSVFEDDEESDSSIILTNAGASTARFSVSGARNADAAQATSTAACTLTAGRDTNTSQLQSELAAIQSSFDLTLRGNGPTFGNALLAASASCEL